jgi:hypothetical protein
MWGALFDERTGLSFTIAAGPCQRSLSQVRVPWYSRPYFTVSELRLPFSSPPTTRRVTVEVFVPASTWESLGHHSCLQDNPSARTIEKTHLQILLRIRGNVCIEPLPRNGFRNTTVLLLRDIATDCLPSISFPSNQRAYARRCLSCRCLAIHVTVLSICSMRPRRFWV